jgi:hypothetical protein
MASAAGIKVNIVEIEGVAEDNAASSSVARYSLVARLTASASSSLFHRGPAEAHPVSLQHLIEGAEMQRANVIVIDPRLIIICWCWSRCGKTADILRSQIAGKVPIKCTVAVKGAIKP